MRADPFVISNLAAAFLAGSAWSVEALVRRAALACGQRARWLRPLARRIVERYPTTPRPPAAALEALIRADAGFQRAGADPYPVGRIYWTSDVMAPAAGAPATWNVPALTSPRALAEWLGIELAELDWFADCQDRNRHAPVGPLRHYTYRWLLRRGRRPRLLEIPKARLKALQRRLLHELLERIPPHSAAHGYRCGHSISTYVAPHAGRRIVLHLDLRQFFASTRASRVHALFRTAGYPAAVARLLTGLCTSVVPAEVLADDANYRLLVPHLPQGAPTSPALANLCAYCLDCRLAGLSHALGASYSRYADDLLFSGDARLERCVRRFHVTVCRLALEEGYEVNTRKSHFLRQGVRQRVAGVVLNVRPNICRADHDRLKAILTNCVRHGPHAQNRAGHADFRAHLAGRIAYIAMLNPARGQRLRELFTQIAWDNDNAGKSDIPRKDAPP